ncbi:hypothetical protein [Nocardia macrotermitis]|uniref:Uncharacterized protein n=1 Tax=Nocardia macrotermitis TaxID=2585198 RepID=A0A7K0D7F2_9NOCA|nr:hypothetical protein [Nocardia macrotermitis]MQY21262.1 hypothetical protein [Nocardia macrotermitis]
MRERLRIAGFAGAAVVLVVLIPILGWAGPPRPAVIGTDRLGPDSGEPVADYLARARDSLRGDDSGEHWALVTLTAGIVPNDIPKTVAGLRVSQVIYHVPINHVYTPPITVPTPADDTAVIASARAAAGALDASESFDARTAQTTAVMAARLHIPCRCAVDLIIRGTLPELRTLTTHPNIRSVEALPPNASAGAFAIFPLLPEQTDTVTPGPDDGSVPAR